PAALLARRREGPGALALRGFDDVVVATRVRAVPPAAFQALGSGDDARPRIAQRDRARQQPARTRRTHGRPVDAAGIVFHPPPCALGPRIAGGRHAVYRLVAEARAQPLTQLRPGQLLLAAGIEQIARGRRERRQLAREQ